MTPPGGALGLAVPAVRHPSFSSGAAPLEPNLDEARQQDHLLCRKPTGYRAAGCAASRTVCGLLAAVRVTPASAVDTVRVVAHLLSQIV